LTVYAVTVSQKSKILMSENIC